MSQVTELVIKDLIKEIFDNALGEYSKVVTHTSHGVMAIKDDGEHLYTVEVSNIAGPYVTPVYRVSFELGFDVNKKIYRKFRLRARSVRIDTEKLDKQGTRERLHTSINTLVTATNEAMESTKDFLRRQNGKDQCDSRLLVKACSGHKGVSFDGEVVTYRGHTLDYTVNDGKVGFLISTAPQDTNIVDLNTAKKIVDLVDPV